MTCGLDAVIKRLLGEVRKEFPGWKFHPTPEGWTARLGGHSIGGGSLAEVSARLREVAS